MHKLAVSLAAVGMLLVALPAAAQEAPATSHTLLAAFQGGEHVWLSADGETRNPTLTVPPNAQVTITIRQDASTDGTPHDIQVGGAETSNWIMATDDQLNYTFTSPPSGTVDYLCTIHPSTMSGTIQVADVPRDDPEEAAPTNGTPGFAAGFAGLALVLVALVLRRR